MDKMTGEEQIHVWDKKIIYLKQDKEWVNLFGLDDCVDPDRIVRICQQGSNNFMG